MATIYALLIGINGYPVNPLQGCINDVNAFKEYLGDFDQSADTKIVIKAITDQTDDKPTKAGIISSFGFFDNAKTGDTCLFYYSGHGSFATAPEEFECDNGQVQSFVCLDSRQPGGMDLMDKEMSALVWKTMAGKEGVSFIAITDCCHSGTIMKAIPGGPVFQEDSSVTERMAPKQDSHRPRSVEEYFGYDLAVNGERAYTETFSTNGRIVRVRQAGHIHLSASKDSQTSKELDIEGVRRGAFTYSLLKALKAAGNRITYTELVDKISAMVKNMVRDQQPNVNVNGGLSSKVKERFFLSLEKAVYNPSYFIYFDPAFGWCMKGGLVHGITKGDRVIIDNGLFSTIVTASPTADISILLGKPEFGGKANTYYGKIQPSKGKAIKLTFDPDIDPPIKSLVESFIAASKDIPVVLETSGSADYLVRTNSASEVYITLPGNETPVFKPLAVNDDAGTIAFFKQVELVGTWTRIKQFENGAPVLKNKQHYSIQLFRTTTAGDYDRATFEEVIDIQPVNDLYFKQSAGKWYMPAIRVAITNHLPDPLVVTNVYLGFDYEITTDYFDTMDIAPGNTAWLLFVKKQGMPTDVIKMNLDEKYRKLGYTEAVEYIKLFLSTRNKMSTDHLAQPGVALADVWVSPQNRDVSIQTKSPSDDEDEFASFPASWQTETLGFRIIRPLSEVEIRPGEHNLLGSITLDHAQLSAKATLTSTAHITRSGDGVSSRSTVYKNNNLETFDLNPETIAGKLDVLELFDVADKSVVTRDRPLTIRQAAGERSFTANEVLPLGYDADSGLYYPVGFTDPNGNIQIYVLPDESASDQTITQRSFFGSIKIYFQKVIGEKLGFVNNYPRLAIASVTADNRISYKDDKKLVKAAVAKADRIILFIHGIIGDTEGMVKSVALPLDANGTTLHSKTDLVLAFDYENLNTKIQDTSELLRQKLADVDLGPGHGKTLVVIAHSMGGLVCRKMIEVAPQINPISRLIMLGTPNNGSPWADVRDLAEVLLTFAINGSAFLQPYMIVLAGIGKLVKGVQVTLKQMDSETGMYSDLNLGIDPLIPYNLIAGNTKKIVADYDDKSTKIARLFARLKQRGVYDALDRVLFKMDNDIAATDDSIIQIKGSQDWEHKAIYQMVASDHMSYFGRVECIIIIYNHYCPGKINKVQAA